MTPHPILADIWQALGFPDQAANRLDVTGSETLPSCYPVTDLAVASIGASCLAVSELIGLQAAAPRVTVDRRLSSLWFGWSIAPIGWDMPSAWDPIAGDYEAADGWIKLHTNAPHHRAAALSILKCEASKEAVAERVRGFSADALEAAIIEAGGCAATMRGEKAWLIHPQGQAVAAEPLISTSFAVASRTAQRPIDPNRPLAGIRVLDLTRVLAGPVATRFLAGYGADVLRIDPLAWDEPGVIPEVTLGKRCARLDLHANGDRECFEALVAGADVMVHGYRKGALSGLGYDADVLQSLRPGLIDVSLNAYGHSGPLSTRRGFDSLVQMSAGIADAGMAWRSADRPVPLPVQALDHATGYLIAAAAVRGLHARITTGHGGQSRLSLARTAKLLIDHKSTPTGDDFKPARDDDYAKSTETSSWGPAQRLVPPGIVEGCPMQWARPATTLGSDNAEWLS